MKSGKLSQLSLSVSKKLQMYIESEYLLRKASSKASMSLLFGDINSSNSARDPRQYEKKEYIAAKSAMGVPSCGVPRNSVPTVELAIRLRVERGFASFASTSACGVSFKLCFKLRESTWVTFLTIIPPKL
jgi:hypothetical protein